jgi:malate dehydrogenase
MSRKRQKVSVVGGGYVGSTLAHWIVSSQLADVALIDIQGDMAKGKALDLFEATPVGGQDSQVLGGDSYTLSEGSDVVVVTAGIARKPGMSRDDLLKTNAGIVGNVAENIRKHAPESVVIVVSNPLDAMCHVFLHKSGFDSRRVMGMAGILDTARYKAFIAEAARVSVKDIQAVVLGGHGDTMVPLSRFTTVGGVPLTHFLNHDQIAAIEDRTRKGGAEIVGLLKTGSAYYAPSYSTFAMVESILKDERRVLPCSAFCRGEYGVDDLYVGVPVVLGAEGVLKIFELELNAQEKTQMNHSAQAVQELVKVLKTLELIN